MTSEAQEYLRELFRKNPQKFIEFKEDFKFGITKATLDKAKLSFDEQVEIRYHIHHGSPSILLVEDFRSRPFEKGGIEHSGNEPYVHIINSDDIDKFYSNEEEKFFDKLNKSPIYTLDKKGNPIKLTDPIDDISEERLREKLKEEESKENYEMCAEILKYAESKGINL